MNLKMNTLVIILCSLAPSVIAAGEYKQPTPDNAVWQQIDRYLTKNAVKDHYGKSWLLSRCKRPYTMTAISIVESGCNDNARGKFGEISAFQILKPSKKTVQGGFAEALEEAEKILDNKITEQHSYSKGISGYNGNPKNIKTKYYSQKVLNVIGEVYRG